MALESVSEIKKNGLLNGFKRLSAFGHGCVPTKIVEFILPSIIFPSTRLVFPSTRRRLYRIRGSQKLGE